MFNDDKPGSFFSANEGDLRSKERNKMEKINPKIFMKERKQALKKVRNKDLKKKLNRDIINEQ